MRSRRRRTMSPDEESRCDALPQPPQSYGQPSRRGWILAGVVLVAVAPLLVAGNAVTTDDESRASGDATTGVLLGPSRAATARSCGRAEDVCSESEATVCLNGSCVSACALKGMHECKCELEEDNYCYLCCGNRDHECRAAHHHGILRSNGERWERDACYRCASNRAEMEGLPCDDLDPARLCLQGRCSKSVCNNKLPGAYCDRKMEKICVDESCQNPCAAIAPHLMVCDCPSIDPDTGFASDDRCQLCCYDFNLKPASRRCQNAYRKYKIATSDGRPIYRVGLECAGGRTCTRFGACGAASTRTVSPLLPGLLVVALIAIAACFSVH